MGKAFNEEIFKPDFVLNGPHLVAASAGTGKTHNIQNVYVRLVIEKGLHVSEIQVMTFTEAATKELRDRVRKVLAGISDLYGGRTEGMPSHERERYEKLRACARANLTAGDTSAADTLAMTRIERALVEFDQASISTIHGFCGRALKRFAFETNGNFAAEFLDDKGAELARIVRDWWRNGCEDAPDAVRESLDRGQLDGFVRALSEKADWTLDEVSPTEASEWMLKKAADFVAGYEGGRPLRETQTFDDLLRALREALLDGERGKALAARLRVEFKAALIDEFQDTDPVQYDVFRMIFLTPEAMRNTFLFFVGDPKQAIYSFRGGDIFAYKRAATGPAVKGRTFELDTNYRSTPRLVAAVNKMFGDRARSRTFGDDAIAYAGDLKASDVPGMIMSGGKPDPAPFRIVQFSREAGGAYARDRYVVQAVLETLSEQEGLKPKDIAILVGSNAAGKDFRDALKKVHVHAVVHKPGNVFSGSAASDLRLVMLAMSLSGGVGQIRASLATHYFELSPEEILDEEKLASHIGLFNELNGIWRAKGFGAAFAELDQRVKFRMRMARVPDGERILADVFQILDLAEDAVKTLGPSPEALVVWLTERINSAEAEQDSDVYARQVESDKEALKIMTVHGSKGLQFPVVIVPATRGMAVKAPYFYHDVESRLKVGLSDEAKSAAKAESDAERNRYLYVAFTRASKRTVVIAASTGGTSPLGKLFANARANGAGEDVADSPIRWIKDPKIIENPAPYEPDDGTAKELSAALTPRAYSHVPTQGSYSTLAPTHRGENGASHDVDADEPAADVEVPGDEHPIFALRGGAKTGTCWHEILETIPFDIGDVELLARIKESLRVHGCASKDETCAVHEADLVAEMMRKTLSCPLTSPAGDAFSLRDVGSRDRISEWEFDFSSAASAARTGELAAVLREEWSGDASKQPFLAALDGWDRYIPKGFFVGFLDLVFRHDGYYYVVDWKSNGLNRRKSGFSTAGITQEMADAGYFFQYLLYSVALRKYLKETLGDGYSWDKNFGGVRYYFLRGIAAGAAAAVFSDRPSERLLTRLSAALGLEDK